MAVRWGLIVEERVVGYKYSRSATRVLAEVEGTREEALAELRRQMGTYLGDYPDDNSRVRVYRTADGFLHIRDRTEHGIRFSVAELVSDTGDPKAARREARRAAKERRAAERRARGGGWWSKVEDEQE